MAIPKAFKKIAKIKGVAARDKADKAMDAAKGIKQGSPQDKALDKKTKVYNFEYGKKGAKYGKKKGY